MLYPCLLMSRCGITYTEVRACMDMHTAHMMACMHTGVRYGLLLVADARLVFVALVL